MSDVIRKSDPMKSATTTTKMKRAMMRAEPKTICTLDNRHAYSTTTTVPLE